MEIERELENAERERARTLEGLRMSHRVHEVIFKKKLSPAHPAVAKFTRDSFACFGPWRSHGGTVDLDRLREVCDAALVTLGALPDGSFMWNGPEPSTLPASGADE